MNIRETLERIKCNGIGSYDKLNNKDTNTNFSVDGKLAFNIIRVRKNNGGHCYYATPHDVLDYESHSISEYDSDDLIGAYSSLLAYTMNVDQPVTHIVTKTGQYEGRGAYHFSQKQFQVYLFNLIKKETLRELKLVNMHTTDNKEYKRIVDAFEFNKYTFLEWDSKGFYQENSFHNFLHRIGLSVSIVRDYPFIMRFAYHHLKETILKELEEREIIKEYFSL